MRIIVYSVFVRAIVCIGICSVQRRFSPMDLSCTRYFLPFFLLVLFFSAFLFVVIALWLVVFGNRETANWRNPFYFRSSIFFLLLSSILLLGAILLFFIAMFSLPFNPIFLHCILLYSLSSYSLLLCPFRNLSFTLFLNVNFLRFYEIFVCECRVHIEHAFLLFRFRFRAPLRSYRVLIQCLVLQNGFIFLSLAFVFRAFISCIKIRLLSGHIDLQCAHRQTHTHTYWQLSKRKQRACQKQNDVIIIIRWRTEIGEALGRNLQSTTDFGCHKCFNSIDHNKSVVEVKRTKLCILV